MKAWLVREKDEFCATVVFAETISEAKSIALTTECCEDVDFINLEARRMPQMDKYYNAGKTEIDWNIPQDRIILCKEGGFFCEDTLIEDCLKCCAKKYCDYFLDNYSDD